MALLEVSMPKKKPEALMRALDRVGVTGFPAEVWATIATALAPDGVEFTVADAEGFARVHPGDVDRYETADGVLYRPKPDAERDAMNAVLAEPSIAQAMRELVGPSMVDDDIAVALVGLLRRSPDDSEVRFYLDRYLPDHCADGVGAGIDALRALSDDLDIDGLLASALSRRAGRVAASEGASLRREAIELFEATGQQNKAAEERAVLATTLQRAGDLPAAVRELQQALGSYVTLAAQAPFYSRFVALTLLNLGRLQHDAGQRRDAIRSLKAAVSRFEALAEEDYRFADEVRVATRELRRVRWRRRR